MTIDVSLGKYKEYIFTSSEVILVDYDTFTLLMTLNTYALWLFYFIYVMRLHSELLHYLAQNLDISNVFIKS